MLLRLLWGLLSPASGVVLLASLGTLHWKLRRCHGAICPAVWWSWADSKHLSGQVVDQEVTFGALLWCCLCLSGNEGDGRLIEMYGFGVAVVNDKLQLVDVDIYYKPEPFIQVGTVEKLTQVAQTSSSNILQHPPTSKIDWSVRSPVFQLGMKSLHPSGWTLYHPCVEILRMYQRYIRKRLNGSNDFLTQFNNWKLE